MTRTKLLAIAGCLLALSAPTADARPGTDPAKFEVGMNLARVADWVPTWVFVDAFKQCRPWYSTKPLELTPDGYPLLTSGQTAMTALFNRIGGHYPAGTYTLTYKGKGSIAVQGDGKITSQTGSTLSVAVTPSSRGIMIVINSSDRNDPIRDIRFVMPGFAETYQTAPFHPKFLERLAPFKVVRFMDFQMTNGSSQQNWVDRATPAYYTQGGDKGVALEHMVDLCNRIGADPWFCIPHRATDDYVKNFATYVRDHLAPTQKCYIEYSNEIWNDMFGQAKYAESEGLARGLSTMKYEARARFTSKRAVEVFNQFEAVFGGTSRLVRVMAAQKTNPTLGELLLNYDGASQKTDALAIAEYFGGQLGTPRFSPTPPKTIDEVIAGCRSALTLTRSFTDQYLALAKRFHLPLVAYEGGQALITAPVWNQDKTLQALFDDANRDPRMGDIYREHLAQWKSLGGGLFMEYAFCYAPSQYGRWGVLEWMDQADSAAPKYKALLDVIELNKASGSN